MIEVKRYEKNPILRPTTNWWESEAVFNCAALKKDGTIVLIYRALGKDNISRFGYAETQDGFHISRRDSEPFMEPLVSDLSDNFGIEDPRVTYLNGRYYITYTATTISKEKTGNNNFFSSLVAKLKKPSIYAPWSVRGRCLVSRDLITFERIDSFLDNKDDKDVILFPEKINNDYVVLDRIYPNITLTTSRDLHHWSHRKVVMKPIGEGWESGWLGGGTVPIKTEKGWLIFYHAGDQTRTYRMGYAILDLSDPSKVIYRHPDPILEAKEEYETNGRVKNVVFPCGAVEMDGKILIYYGAADQYIGVAEIEKTTLLKNLD